MEFELTKEYIGTYNHEEEGTLRECRMFTVSTPEKVVGRFFYHEKLCFFSYDGRDIQIRQENRLLKPQFLMVDRGTGLQLGKYNIYDWAGSWSKEGSFRTMTDKTYFFKEIKATVNWTFKRRHTSGNYKLSYGNDSERAEYNFLMDGICQICLGSRNQRHLPFTGTINLIAGDVFTVFTGIFLLERYIEFLDEITD